MNVSEIYTELLAFFLRNDTFELEKNYKDIVTISIDDDFSKAMVAKGLDVLVQTRMVEKVEHNGKQWYVLVKPLDTYQQQISLGYPTNVQLALMINELARERGEKYACNPLELKELDIVYLIHAFMNEPENDQTN